MHEHHHKEQHLTSRHAWLRAGVLGANDGIISTACLLAGFTGAQSSAESLIFAGLAAIAAGSLSMAAGEAVSVSSQADAEKAELQIEAQHLEEHPEMELEELIQIYEARGLNRDLAEEVAKALMATDALEAHARDELGLTELNAARPWTAAISSALSFIAGAAVPFAAVLVALFLGASQAATTALLFGATLLTLLGLGYVSAALSRAPKGRAMVRIFLWGLGALIVSLYLGEGASHFLN